MAVVAVLLVVVSVAAVVVHLVVVVVAVVVSSVDPISKGAANNDSIFCVQFSLSTPPHTPIRRTVPAHKVCLCPEGFKPVFIWGITVWGFVSIFPF